MEKEYINRYGDHILFTQIDENTVEMSGYPEQWLRIGFSNDYSEAYEVYCLGKENPISYQEFVHELEEVVSDTDEFHSYTKHVTYDPDNLNMVDPSGGPCIFIDTNLGQFFEDGIERRVKSIKLEDKKVVFYI